MNTKVIVYNPATRKWFAVLTPNRTVYGQGVELEKVRTFCLNEGWDLVQRAWDEGLTWNRGRTPYAGRTTTPSVWVKR